MGSVTPEKYRVDATVCRYLFTAKLLYMFRVSQHPSSGVLKTTLQTPVEVIILVQLLPRNVACRPRWGEVAVPEAAVTVLSTPDDGCCYTRNM